MKNRRKAMSQMETAVVEVKGWGNEELVMLALILRMMELDPTLEKLERVLRKGAKMVHRLKSHGQDRQ
jgi:hypothetical protein